MTPKHMLMVAAAALALSGCMVHVADDDGSAHRDGESTACSVSCPTIGKASASCRPDQTPSCGCQPAPAAVCVGSRARYL